MSNIYTKLASNFYDANFAILAKFPWQFWIPEILIQSFSWFLMVYFVHIRYRWTASWKFSTLKENFIHPQKVDSSTCKLIFSNDVLQYSLINKKHIFHQYIAYSSNTIALKLFSAEVSTRKQGVEKK